jgi:hypothetical protein
MVLEHQYSSTFFHQPGGLEHLVWGGIGLFRLTSVHFSKSKVLATARDTGAHFMIVLWPFTQISKARCDLLSNAMNIPP